MTDVRGELLAAYEAVSGLVVAQKNIIDRLFQALSQVADIDDEDLEAICDSAKLLEKAKEKGYI